MGRCVANRKRQKRIVMSDWKETNRLRKLQEEVASEKGIRADTPRRLMEKVDQFSESHRASGLPDDLLNILKDDLDSELNPNITSC
jgi:DNA sulfur modification protein DndC